MSETLTALEVCCCGNCAAQGHQKETIRPLTAEEIAQIEIDSAAYAAEKAEREAESVAKAAAKQSAQDKLKGLGLSDSEIAAITGGI